MYFQIQVMSDFLSLCAPLILALIVFYIIPSCSVCFKLKRRVINRFKTPYDFQGSLTLREKDITSPYLFLFVDRFTRPCSHFVKVKEISQNTSNLLAELQITVQSQAEVSQVSNQQDTKRPALSLRASNYAEDIPQTPLSMKTYNRTERSKGKENKRSRFRKLKSFEGIKHCFSPLAQGNIHTHSSIENSFLVEEAKRAAPSEFHNFPPTPDALTPDSSVQSESIEEEIEEGEGETEKRIGDGRFSLKFINKSRNPRYVRVKELGQPKTIRSKSTFNNSSFLEHLQPSIRRFESEQSLPQNLIKPNLRSSRQNSMPIRTLTTSLDESVETDSPDSCLFKPFINEIQDKINRRKFLTQFAKGVRSQSPVSRYVSMNNEEFNRVLKNDQNNYGGLLACIRDQASTAGATPLQFFSQYSKPILSRKNSESKRRESDYSGENQEYSPQKRESHLFYGRSPDIYFSSGKLLTGLQNSSQNLFKMETPSAIADYGSRKISNVSSALFGGQEGIERGRSRIRADELISYPSNEEAELAQDLLKQLSPYSDKPIRPFDCQYEPSLEQKPDSKIPSPTSELYVHTQSAYGSGHESHLKSIHESSEPQSRSYSRLSPKVVSPVTKKSHRVSTFKSPKRAKIQESETKSGRSSTIEFNSLLMLSFPNSRRLEEEATVDVTDCETLPYTIFSRSEVLSHIIDLLHTNKQSYFTQMRGDTQEVNSSLNEDLKDLDLRLKYGRYARDFTIALVKKKLSLFSQLRNPQLKKKYRIEAQEDEEDKEEVRLELEAFRQSQSECTDPYRNKKFRYMGNEEAFLFLLGVNPFQEYKFLNYHRQFSKELSPPQDSSVLEHNSRKLENELQREKELITQNWSDANLRFFSHVRTRFTSSVASFKVVLPLLLLKEFMAIILVGMSCHFLSQRWSQTDNRQEIMLTWACMALLSLILGFLILEPLSLWIRFRIFIFLKGKRNKCADFLFSLDQFRKYENDRHLVENYRQRRLLGREELYALSDSPPANQDANKEAHSGEKKTSLNIYKQLYFE